MAFCKMYLIFKKSMKLSLTNIVMVSLNNALKYFYSQCVKRKILSSLNLIFFTKIRRRLSSVIAMPLTYVNVLVQIVRKKPPLNLNIKLIIFKC